MSGWLSFCRWLRYKQKGRRFSFPLDDQFRIYKMREMEDLHDYKKTYGLY